VIAGFAGAAFPEFGAAEVLAEFIGESGMAAVISHKKVGAEIFNCGGILCYLKNIWQSQTPVVGAGLRPARLRPTHADLPLCGVREFLRPVVPDILARQTRPC
jgi:hypothetical protein